MNILIVGSRGFIGSHLSDALMSYHNIHVCNQDFNKMTEPDRWFPFLENIDAVVNCVGIIKESKSRTFETTHYKAPVALFQACEQKGVKRVVQISALGADQSATTSYHKTKKQADDFLRQSNLDWFILYPSLVYGENGKSFAFFKKLSNLPMIPLVGNGQQLIQPVHIEVLIMVIKAGLESKQTRQSINVVGENPLSYKQWMQKLRSRNSKPWFLPIPFWMFRLAAFILKPFNLQFLTNDNLSMLQRNNIADFTPLKNFLEKLK